MDVSRERMFWQSILHFTPIRSGGDVRILAEHHHRETRS